MSAKTIKLKNPANSNEYLLELNRDEVVKLEQKGITANALHDMPVTAVFELFDACFNMHARRVSANERKELYSKVQGEKLTTKLLDMYSESIDSLTAENEEGNAMWEASW